MFQDINVFSKPPETNGTALFQKCVCENDLYAISILTDGIVISSGEFGLFTHVKMTSMLKIRKKSVVVGTHKDFGG